MAFHILKQYLTSVLGGIFPKVEETEDGGTTNPDAVFVVGTVILKNLGGRRAAVELLTRPYSSPYRCLLLPTAWFMGAKLLQLWQTTAGCLMWNLSLLVSQRGKVAPDSRLRKWGRLGPNGWKILLVKVRMFKMVGMSHIRSHIMCSKSQNNLWCFSFWHSFFYPLQAP